MRTFRGLPPFCLGLDDLPPRKLDVEGSQSQLEIRKSLRAFSVPVRALHKYLHRYPSAPIQLGPAVSSSDPAIERSTHFYEQAGRREAREAAFA